MTMPLRALIVFCGLLAGAHFLRFGTVWECLAALLPALGALFPRLVPRPLMALALVAGFWLWTDQAAGLIATRLQFDMPYLRLAAILGAVCLLHVAGLVLLLGRAGHRLLGPVDSTTWAQSAAMLLVGAAMIAATVTAPFPLLLGERFLPGSSPAWIGFFAMYAGVVVRHMLTGSAPRVRAFIWSLFSLVFFGQLALGLGGMTEFLMTGKLHLPVPALILAGPLYRGEGLFMPILLGVSLLLVGPAWCSHLCYIGAWDDQLSRLGPKRPRPLPAWAPRVRTGILAGTILVPLALRLAGVTWAWALGVAVLFGLTGIGIMALWSRKSGTMVHCTMWCPVGLVNNLVGRILPWRVRIAPDCTGCGLCARACRYNALTLEDLARKRPGLSCSLCGDCLPRCPHGHINLTLAGHTRYARPVFVVLVVALHTIFLAVARI
ncbi:MAG: 4Fe-4S binding protein [Deltaproteobacteria bacterium]|nr:4Fe-4S binding protein [Deltaproteobacteria bacterium]